MIITSSFYTHLVTVLGSHDFLAPVVMLLIEKTANRVVRQSPEDLDLTLSLPLAVIQHHPPELQLHVSVPTVSLLLMFIILV